VGAEAVGGEENTAPAAPWLNAVEMRAWRGLLRAQALVLTRLDEELLAAHHLSMAEYEVLVHLAAAPGGALRMSELAERALVSRSGLTRRVDGMAAAGLVERRSCPSDRRGTFAVLTEAGRARLAEAAPTHVAGVRRHFLDHLGAEELVGLADALDAVVAGRDRTGDEPAR
jgi:DNA-binding MarR family transcriptional regulator